MVQLKHRHVVSNFLFKIGRTDSASTSTSLIALFRRSNCVRTYQGKLAPISGTVEEGERPFDTAVREIQEETGLHLHQDYEAYLTGKPFIVIDRDIGRSWTVHPFSWRIKGSTSPEFQIDWEHDTWSWYDPAILLNGGLAKESIPNLTESLSRVWLSNSAIFEDWQIEENQTPTLLWNSLCALRDDHDSGASYMAGLALRHFQNIVASFLPHSQRSRYWWQLRMIAWHIINNGRPSMNAAITRALLSVLQQIEGCHDRVQIVSKIENSLSERASMSCKITDSFVSYIERLVAKRQNSTMDANQHPSRIKILTLSASITKTAILGVLQRLPDVEIDLRIMESRPLCEGAQMAAKLLQNISKSEEARLQVTIATDASVAILARGIDLVLLGADRISADGDVSNKTGSFAAALCARAVGNKSPDSTTPRVLILSGTEKIAKREELHEHAAEDNSSSQVWRVWELAGCKQEVILLQSNKRVLFKNVFFEWVPAEYIDSYITEHGELSTEQIQKQSVHIEEMETELFDF